MTKLERAPGLIRYSTESALKRSPSRILRPRIVIYTVIVTVYLISFTLGLSHRRAVEYQIIRVAKNAPFTVEDGKIVSNHFRIHVTNREKTPAEITLRVLEPTAASAIVPLSPFILGAQADGDLPLFIRFPKELLKLGKTSVRIEVLNRGERLAI